jgi:hypothetical protein
MGIETLERVAMIQLDLQTTSNGARCDDARSSNPAEGSARTTRWRWALIWHCIRAAQFLWLCVLIAPAALATEAQGDCPTVIAVVGAAGTPEYGRQFRTWLERWRTATEQRGGTFCAVGLESDANVSDRQRLQDLLSDKSSEANGELWLVLIGHGTFDGQNAKFNLRGPDFAADELAQWISGCRRRLIVVNCASCSGPFINRLSSSDRVIITATKSGYELNFSRFGDYLSKAIDAATADLDKDGQTSLLEAFLLASAQVREYYQQEARLATEQALIDDNGDGRGTPAQWFHGIYPVRKAQDEQQLDGIMAHGIFLLPGEKERQLSDAARDRRDLLERRIAELRESKQELGEEEYFSQLEPLMVELAQIYESGQPHR